MVSKMRTTEHRIRVPMFNNSVRTGGEVPPLSLQPATAADTADQQPPPDYRFDGNCQLEMLIRCQVITAESTSERQRRWTMTKSRASR
ncbi:hypothetical protein ACI65C_006043 [Semiaphis heraclei]